MTTFYHNLAISTTHSREKLRYMVFMNRENRLIRFLKDMKKQPLCWASPNEYYLPALYEEISSIPPSQTTEEEFDAYQLLTAAYMGEMAELTKPD